uniref:Uncharacterized protein n=1 Tax=Vespula pensylvanica TaxID=30213 RepID=A0A834PFC8_VESPE|nr:hypothetical protein H0235_001030 [Vespula pensylvanica]
MIRARPHFHRMSFDDKKTFPYITTNYSSVYCAGVIALGGFGFITFADPASVDKVLTQGNHELDGKKIQRKILLLACKSKLSLKILDTQLFFTILSFHFKNIGQAKKRNLQLERLLKSF